ncbi:trypsin domain-containing protein [Cardiosporidium cionae]|uniref:Trypsin domain-containing protein n=1 Tax=Cardiosporidium cionae TaxID=476202 RepID=A0ABQ7JED7_9APIC|nr:trypsin domain-containing protein [Cardiosporidium cionae]|eukprot:KAF8822254.1 trypsin domain-containing protein [Cardiosporidium cionae]
MDTMDEEATGLVSSTTSWPFSVANARHTSLKRRITKAQSVITPLRVQQRKQGMAEQKHHSMGVPAAAPADRQRFHSPRRREETTYFIRSKSCIPVALSHSFSSTPYGSGKFLTSKEKSKQLLLSQRRTHQTGSFVARKSSMKPDKSTYDAGRVHSRERTKSIPYHLSYKNTKKASVVPTRRMASKKASYRQSQRLKHQEAAVETRQSRRLSKNPLALPPLENALSRYQTKEDSQSAPTTEAESGSTSTKRTQRLNPKQSSANALANFSSRLKTYASSPVGTMLSSGAKASRSDTVYVKTRAQKTRYLKCATEMKSSPRYVESSSQVKRFFDSKENNIRQKNLGNAVNEKEDAKNELSEDMDEEMIEKVKKTKTFLKKRTLRSVMKSRATDKVAQRKRKKRKTRSPKTSGSDPRMLLTNAHSVQYAAVVQVRKRGDHQKYEAKVLCVGYDCDLAILSVEEDAFWQNMNALEWGNSPRLEDPVTVVGYPVGGDNTCVTQGVVSRIDFQRYTVGSCNLLAIQIDAAINGGNSGGPALNRDKECVGIAFQSLKDSDTENIGYIIPCEVVFHFMEDYSRHGMYTGFGSCSFIWQKVENKCMQMYFGLKERNTGILISKIDKTSPAYGLLKKGDIVLSIDDNDIATDGTVSFSNGERIAFEWLLCQKFAGEHIRFSILRNKRNKEIVLPVVRSEPLVPTYLPEEKKPEYFIAGGLVFIPLTELFLTSEYGQDCLCRAPGHLVTASNRSHREFEDEQIVVIGHILAHEITVGYEDFSHYCIREFNGQKIRNLRHLASLIENSTDDFWRFDIDCDMVIILNAEASRSSISDILKQNMIPAAKSDSLF